MDFYDAILLYKIKNKSPYRALGKPIGLSADAIRMALVRQSLSQLQKKELSKAFGLEDLIVDKGKVAGISSHLEGNPLTLPSLSLYPDIEIISYINTHKMRFFNIPSFKKIIYSLTLDTYIEDVRREVNLIIRSFQKGHEKEQDKEI
ncbi:hypothetical protein [Arenibacter lacus]|uniref:hypothetical protein n=1 Tax=Arenibacter lacus TaxID=2608629 RepID=UPI00123E0252|nr:hypothetical protein [Arenibacter lacus]